MTRSQRRHLRSGVMLGVAITLMVVTLDALGRLEGLENWLYGQRAARCQVFMPRPTTQLVHLDIDDETLEEIGVLPWPRTVVADVVDELRVLGARVIALDMIMPDPQTNRGDAVDHDGNLAAAIARHGGVLVPLSLTIGRPGSENARRAWMVAEFLKDLETPLGEMEQRAKGKFGEVPQNQVIFAREEAARQAVMREMAGAERAISVDEMGKRLLPGSWGRQGAGSEKLKDSVRAYVRQEESRRILRRLVREGAPVGGMLRAVGDLPPVPVVASAAAYTGFVDHLPFDDGVVRAVPMWMEYRGALYPFMGLRMACAMMGVPIEQVRIEADRVVIPRPVGGDLVLPAITHPSAKVGRDAGMLLRVPWFGTNVWETMYDWPEHKEAKQHVPFGMLWQAVKSRRAAVRNNLQVDKALKYLVSRSKPPEAERFLAEGVPADDVSRRLVVTLKVIKEFDDLGWIAEFRKMTPAELEADDVSRAWIEAYDALIAARRANEQAITEEAKLRYEFDGKAVLVGSIASGAADFVTTPLHAQCPGAVVHGAVFNAVMTGFVWKSAPVWAAPVATVAVGILVTLMVALWSPWAALGGTVAVIAGYLGLNGYVVFDWGKTILPAAGPVVAAGAVWGGVTLTQYFVERGERKRITDRFRSYADEQLVDYVLEAGDTILEGQEQELTVVFTDIKGYTSLMERLGKRIVPVLNEYLGRMVPIIHENGGLVNKFMGDGIMFFYGAPRPNHDHAAAAVATVIEMQVAVRDFNRWLTDQGLDPVAVRAGVSTGFMIVGDAGARQRSDYTVLGDTVNLASRLEGANKYFGTAIMISERTREMLDGRFLVRPIGRVRVVGRAEWVMTYEPVAVRGEETEEQRELAAVTERMVGAFVGGRFEECVKAAEEGIERFGGQKLFEVYRALAGKKAGKTAEGFDGVVELAEK